MVSQGLSSSQLLDLSQTGATILGGVSLWSGNRTGPAQCHPAIWLEAQGLLRPASKEPVLQVRTGLQPVLCLPGRCLDHLWGRGALRESIHLWFS